MPKHDLVDLSEEWTPPTGIQTVKKGSRELYQYVFEKGGGRFVNTNKICKTCKYRGQCYTGAHASVGACINYE